MSPSPNTSSAPRWMSLCLVAAGMYNLLWGGLTVLVPGWLFDLTGMERPTYPFIWQCVGMAPAAACATGLLTETSPGLRQQLSGGLW